MDGDQPILERYHPSAARAIDMKFGPDRDLWVLEYGSMGFAKSETPAGPDSGTTPATAHQGGGVCGQGLVALALALIRLPAAVSIDHALVTRREYERRVQLEAGLARRARFVLRTLASKLRLGLHGRSPRSSSWTLQARGRFCVKR